MGQRFIDRGVRLHSSGEPPEWLSFVYFLCHLKAHDVDSGFVGACALIST